MRFKYKLIIGIIIFFTALAIFSDWQHFKDGLFGNPPETEVQK